MYIASTKAKKGRTFLLTLVFSAILIFILAGLIIQNAALTAIDNAKNEAGATVTLSTSRDQAFGRMEEPSSEDTTTPQEPKQFSITPVDLTVAAELAQLDNVASYNYISSTSANASSFDAIALSSSSNTESSTSIMSGGGKAQMMAAAGDLTISGTSSTDTLSDFTSGTSTLIEGVGISEADVDTNNAVIETNLTEANDLSVGDTIEITYGDDDTAVELTIVGIYESASTLDSMMMQMTAMNPANEIYTPYTLANIIKGTDYENTADSVVYTLSDPEQVDAFIADEESAGLDTDTYSLTSNTQMYEQMLQPLENVKEFASQIVLLVSVAGVSGKYVGNVVGEQLLNQESKTTTELAAGSAPNESGMRGGFDKMQNFGASSQETAEQISELNIAVSTTDLLEWGGFGLLITMGSIIVATVGIMRLQPKKILIS